MIVAPSAECEKCAGQIGTEHYVVCLDGITSKVVTFHKRCEPGDPDLQRHHKIALAPGTLGLMAKGIA